MRPQRCPWLAVQLRAKSCLLWSGVGAGRRGLLGHREKRAGPARGFPSFWGPSLIFVPALDTALGDRVDVGCVRVPVSLYRNTVHVHACVSCVSVRASVSPSVNRVNLSRVHCIEGFQKSIQEALNKHSVPCQEASGRPRFCSETLSVFLPTQGTHRGTHDPGGLPLGAGPRRLARCLGGGG